MSDICIVMAVNGLMHRNKVISPEEFPAHFHINILPEYQSAGIGAKVDNYKSMIFVKKLN